MIKIGFFPYLSLFFRPFPPFIFLSLFYRFPQLVNFRKKKISF